jgi:hypothetical protein
MVITKRRAFLVFGLLCAAFAEVSETDWKLYTQSEFGLYQYDAEGINYFSKCLVRISQRIVLTDRSRTDLVRELGKEYGDVREIITLREIDCAVKKSRILGLIYCSEKGMVIKRESYEPIEWDVIIPDSVDDVLYHEVCE